MLKTDCCLCEWVPHLGLQALGTEFQAPPSQPAGCTWGPTGVQSCLLRLPPALLRQTLLPLKLPSTSPTIPPRPGLQMPRHPGLMEKGVMPQSPKPFAALLTHQPPSLLPLFLTPTPCPRYFLSLEPPPLGSWQQTSMLGSAKLPAPPTPSSRCAPSSPNHCAPPMLLGCAPWGQCCASPRQCCPGDCSWMNEGLIVYVTTGAESCPHVVLPAPSSSSACYP